MLFFVPKVFVTMVRDVKMQMFVTMMRGVKISLHHFWTGTFFLPSLFMLEALICTIKSSKEYSCYYMYRHEDNERKSVRWPYKIVPLCGIIFCNLKKWNEYSTWKIGYKLLNDQYGIFAQWINTVGNLNENRYQLVKKNMNKSMHIFTCCKNLHINSEFSCNWL